jgi:LmbE family N-acetylglucosaminyl deacetylase
VLPLNLGPDRKRLEVLCLGAHSDDIEIGCAGTLMRWLADYERVDVTWAVLSAAAEREAEARASAAALLEPAAGVEFVLGDIADAHFPAHYGRVKAFLQGLARTTAPDVVLTHRLEDAHQDHRLVGEITWQTWRDHLILEYEIPKYEGDLGRPNLYSTLPDDVACRKVDHLMRYFGSQRSKDWFSAETFRGLMRLRGIECRAPSGWAEAFHMRKATL